MKKGDVYYLKRDLDGEIVGRFEIEDAIPSITSDEPCSVTGICSLVICWSADHKIPLDWEFVAAVYCKWDGCTHWNFYGEDHFDDEDEHNAYYHLCGSYCFADHIRMICFVWKLMATLMPSYADEYYYDSQEVRDLIPIMLDGYSIVKREDSNET